MQKSMNFAKERKKTIFDKTISIINYQKKTNIIKFAYCNFNLLEEEENKVGNGVITTLDTTLQQVASE